jgi:hypothetical protein
MACEDVACEDVACEGVPGEGALCEERIWAQPASVRPTTAATQVPRRKTERLFMVLPFFVVGGMPMPMMGKHDGAAV